jgi:hypothetical protein
MAAGCRGRARRGSSRSSVGGRWAGYGCSAGCGGLGVDLALAGCSGLGGSRTDVERVLFALVANHALDSCSARGGGVGNVATSLARIGRRVSRLRREQRWAAAKASVAKRPVAAASLGNARGAHNLLEGTNPSMTPADVQQQRLLERLREAGDQPVAFAELHAGGIDFPAAVVSELELNGYVIERVYDHRRLVGVRLLQPEPRDTPAAPRQRRQHR